MRRSPILVLGCGSIGRRHISNLKSLGRTVVAYDTAADRAVGPGNLKIETVDSVEAGWPAARPRFSSAPRPPPTPGPDCSRSGRGSDVVEKPLASGLADGKTGRDRKIPPPSATNSAFTPPCAGSRSAWKTPGEAVVSARGVRAVSPRLAPLAELPPSYTARKALGGGILLDASHELDLVRWLAGEARSVFCLAKRLALPVDVEDTAALLMEMRSGAIAEVHLDMVQRGFRRGLLISCTRATVTFELPASRVTIVKGPGKSVVKNFPFQSNDLYLAQTRAFLRRLGNSASDGLVSPRDALKTLELVETARKSARTGRKERTP